MKKIMIFLFFYLITPFSDAFASLSDYFDAAIKKSGAVVSSSNSLDKDPDEIRKNAIGLIKFMPKISAKIEEITTRWNAQKIRLQNAPSPQVLREIILNNIWPQKETIKEERIWFGERLTKDEGLWFGGRSSFANMVKHMWPPELIKKVGDPCFDGRLTFHNMIKSYPEYKRSKKELSDSEKEVKERQEKEVKEREEIAVNVRDEKLEQRAKLFANFHPWAFAIGNPNNVKAFEENVRQAIKECIECFAAHGEEEVIDIFKRMNSSFIKRKDGSLLMESIPHDIVLNDLTYLVNEWILRSTEDIYNQMLPYIFDCSTTLRTMERLNEEMDRENEMLPLCNNLKQARIKKKEEDAAKQPPKLTGLFSLWSTKSNTQAENADAKVTRLSTVDDEINDAKIAILDKGTVPPFREIERQDPDIIDKRFVPFCKQIKALNKLDRREQLRKVISPIKNTNERASEVSEEETDQKRASLLKRFNEQILNREKTKFLPQTLTHDAVAYLRSAPKIFTFPTNIHPKEQLEKFDFFMEYYLKLLKTYDDDLYRNYDQSNVFIYLSLLEDNIPQLSSPGYELFFEQHLEQGWISLITVEEFEKKHKEPGKTFMKNLALYISLNSKIKNSDDSTLKKIAEQLRRNGELENMWFFLKKCEVLATYGSLKMKENLVELHKVQFKRWLARQQSNLHDDDTLENEDVGSTPIGKQSKTKLLKTKFKRLLSRKQRPHSDIDSREKADDDDPSSLYINAFKSLFGSISKKLQLEHASLVDLQSLQSEIDDPTEKDERTLTGVNIADLKKATDKNTLDQPLIHDIVADVTEEGNEEPKKTGQSNPDGTDNTDNEERATSSVATTTTTTTPLVQSSSQAIQSDRQEKLEKKKPNKPEKEKPPVTSQTNPSSSSQMTSVIVDPPSESDIKRNLTQHESRSGESTSDSEFEEQ